MLMDCLLFYRCFIIYTCNDYFVWRYHELEAAQAKNGASGVLSGSELEEALQRWSLIDDSCKADSTLTDTELAKLREELTVCRQRRDELKSLHDKLALHHAAIADRVSHIDVILNAAQSEYHLNAQHMHLDNANVSEYWMWVECD